MSEDVQLILLLFGLYLVFLLVFFVMATRAQDAYWAKRRAESCARHKETMLRRFGKIVECNHSKGGE